MRPIAILLLMIGGWFTTSLTAAPSDYLILGPMLGHVSDSEARIWLKASGAVRPSLRVSEVFDLSRSRRISGAKLKEDAAFAGQIVVGGLKPNHRYFYSVLLDGAPAILPPYPSFVTAPLPGAAQHLRFAFTSCSGYEAYDPAASWADIGLRTNVDLILMLGDNHYGNSPRLENQRAAFLGQRSNAGFRHTTARMPTYGIWDDHDFGPNDSDGSMVGKEDALKAFKEHWANPSFGETNNPGVYFKFSRGDVDFFLLDGRYYRSPNKATNSPTKTMLGERQVEWLKQSLLASTAKVKVLASGGEWETHGSPDSWSSFPRERDDILGFIRRQNIDGVVLISGDRHFSAAYQVQKRFLEVTSGPFGATPAQSKHLPEMFMYHGKGRFYCVFDVDTTKQEPALTLEMYQIGVGLVERRFFSWDEVNGRREIPPLEPPPEQGSPKS